MFLSKTKKMRFFIRLMAVPIKTALMAFIFFIACNQSAYAMHKELPITSAENQKVSIGYLYEHAHVMAWIRDLGFDVEQLWFDITDDHLPQPSRDNLKVDDLTPRFIDEVKKLTIKIDNFFHALSQKSPEFISQEFIKLFGQKECETILSDCTGLKLEKIDDTIVLIATKKSSSGSRLEPTDLLSFLSCFFKSLFSYENCKDRVECHADSFYSPPLCDVRVAIVTDNEPLPHFYEQQNKNSCLDEEVSLSAKLSLGLMASSLVLPVLPFAGSVLSKIDQSISFPAVAAEQTGRYSDLRELGLFEGGSSDLPWTYQLSTTSGNLDVDCQPNTETGMARCCLAQAKGVCGSIEIDPEMSVFNCRLDAFGNVECPSIYTEVCRPSTGCKFEKEFCEKEDYACRIDSRKQKIDVLNDYLGQKYQGMNHHVKIVTLSTPGPREQFARKVEENQKEYAARYGYDFVKYEKSLDTSRPEEWSKILALSAEMTGPFNLYKMWNDIRGTSQSRWLLWIDDDIVITNPSINLGEFVEKYAQSPDVNIIIAHDAYYKKGVPINNGIFLIRDCPWSIDFLKRVWDEGSKEKILITRGKSLLEQQAITDLYRQDHSVQKHMVIIEQKAMNSFIRCSFYDDPQESMWEKGDFAAHATGMPLYERTQVISDLIEKGKAALPNC